MRARGAALATAALARGASWTAGPGAWALFFLLFFLGAARGTALATGQVDAARPVVVLDAGHGGANLGARGPALREKALTLRLALRLQQLLTEGGCRVLLTREEDRYLSLRERVRRANSAEPQVFVSLHANASPDHSQRGVETYVLDRGIAEIEAGRLARRAGGPVAALLARLSAEQQLRDSLRLGRLIQDQMVQARGSDRGLRQNDFDVLSGVAAPAVLAEVGFIDHVIEGAELAQPEVQEALAQALCRGVLRFLREPGASSIKGERPPRDERLRNAGPNLNLNMAHAGPPPTQ